MTATEEDLTRTRWNSTGIRAHQEGEVGGGYGDREEARGEELGGARRRDRGGEGGHRR